MIVAMCGRNDAVLSVHVLCNLYGQRTASRAHVSLCCAQHKLTYVARDVMLRQGGASHERAGFVGKMSEVREGGRDLRNITRLV